MSGAIWRGDAMWRARVQTDHWDRAGLPPADLSDIVNGAALYTSPAAARSGVHDFGREYGFELVDGEPIVEREDGADVGTVTFRIDYREGTERCG